MWTCALANYAVGPFYQYLVWRFVFVLTQYIAVFDMFIKVCDVCVCVCVRAPVRACVRACAGGCGERVSEWVRE